MGDITYTPTAWIDVPDPFSPPPGAINVDAAHLLNIEDAIVAIVAWLTGGAMLAPAPSGGDDTATLQAEWTAAAAAGRPYQLRPGAVYRAMPLVPPVGSTLIGRGATIKIPDTVTAGNIFEPTGAWTLIGGTYDGNKANTTDPGVNTAGNGIYQATSGAGWSGAVTLIGPMTFQNFWWGSHHFNNTDATLHDPENAPASAVYMDRVEAVNCNKIAMRFTGLDYIKLVRPNVHGSGSHGIRFFLCKNWVIDDGSSCDNPSGHGVTSLYSKYQLVLGGHYDRNGTTSTTHNGVTFGGDSTSNVNMPGQHIEMVGVHADSNGQHGIIFDASLAGTNALLGGLGVNDPVPVYAKVTDCTANGNVDGDGVIVNSSQWVVIHNPTTDNNGAHGISLATRNATVSGIHRAHGNAQKPLALQGATNWGDHDIICGRDWGGNTPDDSMTIGSPLAACRFSQFTYTRRAVTANTTAKLGELLALDTTGGTFVVTLPEISFFAPGRVHLKWVAGAAAPTIALTGSDKINVSTGTTPPTFSFLNHGYTLESDPATGIWTIVSDDLPLSKLDLRYAPATTGSNVLKGNGSGGFSNATLSDLSGTATGDVSLGSHKLTNVTDPTSAQDAATKNYVDTTVKPVYAAYKASASTRVNTTTLSADSELTIASLPIGVYQLEGFLAYDASAAADVVFSWNMPTGATIVWSPDGIPGSGVAPASGTLNRTPVTTAAGPVVGGGAVGVGGFAKPVGLLTVTTAGAMTLKWALNSADGTTATLWAGSWIRFTKIA